MFFYIVLTPISTTSGLWSTGNTRKYHQINVYIYQCGYYRCMCESSKFPKSWTLEILNLKLAGWIHNLIILSLNDQRVELIRKLIREFIMSFLIQHFEADFLWKVSLKILNSGIILKTFTHADQQNFRVKLLHVYCVLKMMVLLSTVPTSCQDIS